MRSGLAALAEACTGVQPRRTRALDVRTLVLQQNELNLRGAPFDTVHGDFATLSVPCTKIVLKPSGARP